MKNVVTYFHLYQTLVGVWNDINKKFRLLLKLHATPMWIGWSWSWYPYSWTYLVCLGFVDIIEVRCFLHLYHYQKFKNVILIYQDLLWSTKTLIIIFAVKNYSSEGYSYHIVLVWPVPFAQVLPCPQLVFPSKTLCFWNLFESSLTEIALKSISTTFWIQIWWNKCH
jgi:hypothetical protein